MLFGFSIFKLILVQLMQKMEISDKKFQIILI